jgi:hypothetical protein
MTESGNLIRRYLAAIGSGDSRAFRLSLGLIIAGGFALRLWYWYAGESFLYFTINDEVSALKQAFALLAGKPEAFYLGQPAFAGGNAPGPLWTLFTTGLYLLGFKSVQGALFVMALYNTLAVYLVYRIARQFFTPTMTLFTTLLFATSPWTVYFSIGFYNPMSLMVIGALLFMALWHVVNNERSKQVFWVLVILAAVPQFHMVGLFYIPAVLLVLYLSPARINLKWFVLGCLGGIALYLPYLIGDALNGWQNTRAVLAGQEDEFSWSVLKIITNPPALLSNVWGPTLGPEVDYYEAFANQYFGNFLLLVSINVLSFLIGLYLVGYGFYRYLRTLSPTMLLRKAPVKDLQLFVVGTLIFIPLLLFIPSGHDHAKRYLLVAFPVLFLLPALVLNRMPRQGIARALTRVMLVFAILNVYTVFGLYQFQHHVLAADFRFRPSFDHMEQISRALSGQAIPEQGYRVVYSKGIKHLPEGQYKLYRAFGHYLNLRDDKAKQQTLYFYLIGEDPGDKTPVYQSNSLMIYR